MHVPLFCAIYSQTISQWWKVSRHCRLERQYFHCLGLGLERHCLVCCLKTSRENIFTLLVLKVIPSRSWSWYSLSWSHYALPQTSHLPRPRMSRLNTVVAKSLETPCPKWFLISDQRHLEFRFGAFIWASINIFAPNLVLWWKINNLKAEIRNHLRQA